VPPVLPIMDSSNDDGKKALSVEVSERTVAPMPILDSPEFIEATFYRSGISVIRSPPSFERINRTFLSSFFRVAPRAHIRSCLAVLCGKTPATIEFSWGREYTAPIQLEEGVSLFLWHRQSFQVRKEGLFVRNNEPWGLQRGLTARMGSPHGLQRLNYWPQANRREEPDCFSPNYRPGDPPNVLLFAEPQFVEGLDLRLMRALESVQNNAWPLQCLSWHYDLMPARIAYNLGCSNMRAPCMVRQYS
jgi:hypothetical protein